MVGAKTGIVSVIAGNGTPGYQGDGGPASSAELNSPDGLALDGAGNLYIADARNNLIRKVDAKTGLISTVAGFPGSPCCSSQFGDGGPATSASLSFPNGVALDSADNLYISDYSHQRVRKVSASTGIITTFAGSESGTESSGDGGPATSATFTLISGLAIDSADNVYIVAGYDGRIRKITASTGIITTVAGNGNRYGTSGDGGPATSAEINPNYIAFDSADNLFLSDGLGVIRKVDKKTGIISRVVGNGYPGYSGDGSSPTVAGIGSPSGITFDAAGSLYIADTNNYRIRKVAVPGVAPAPFFSVPAGTYTASQTVTVKDAIPGATIYYTTDGTTPTTSSTLYDGPITVSSTGTVKAIAIAPGYTVSSVASAAYVINQPVGSTITWATPAPISYGTALSSAQLNATASVAGTFAYSPSAGTVLNNGQQTLQTTFTPTDTAHYTSATASVTLTVNPATPVISAVASSLNPSLVSNPVALMASVTSAVGAPSGTITFFDGTTQLGLGTLTAGIATYTTSSLAAGAHSITAVYSGDANFASLTSAALTQVVEGFAIGPPSGGSTTATVSPGGHANYGLFVTPPSVGAAVTFSVTGLPAGAKATFSPSTIPAGSGPTNVTLTITVPSSTAALHTGNPFHRGTLPMVLGVILLPFAGRLRKTSRRVLLLAIVGMAGFTMLGLSACGGGGGSGPGGTPTPTPHSYSLTVTATSGSLTQSTALTLNVD